MSNLTVTSNSTALHTACGKTVHSAAELNTQCLCLSASEEDLHTSIQHYSRYGEIWSLIQSRCPHLYARHPVFISQQHAQQIQEFVAQFEQVIQLPHYQSHILASAPDLAHINAGAESVFFGYDFHLTEAGIALIEVNTNAGGAMVNAVLRRALHQCCAPNLNSLPTFDQVSADELEQAFVRMFESEWKSEHPEQAFPTDFTIAIVDEQVDEQFLYPEFLLFQSLFQAHGWRTLIIDPIQLQFEHGQLMHAGQRIDLVYNRLTDFYLDSPRHQVLRQAFEQRGVTLTPTPRAHALYANKGNLCQLSDTGWLAEIGASAAQINTLLRVIPSTTRVTLENADRLWQQRRDYFFKPLTGFGSRATYRGEKLTTRVWQEILKGDYIAQKLIPPSARLTLATDNAGELPTTLKFDLRAYVWRGQVQLLAARTYQGQTTNFRTPGGGFAPVFVLP